MVADGVAIPASVLLRGNSVGWRTILKVIQTCNYVQVSLKKHNFL